MRSSTDSTGFYKGLYRGVLSGLNKGDTRSLDYSSCKPHHMLYITVGMK